MRCHLSLNRGSLGPGLASAFPFARWPGLPGLLSLLSLLAWFTLLAPGACSYKHPPKLPPMPPPETVPAPAPETACVDWRWIGILEDPHATCPDLCDFVPASAGPLVTGLLFPDSGTATGSSNTATCDPTADYLPLSCFCEYQVLDRSIDLKARIGDPRQFGLAALERDCMAVVPAAPSLRQVRRAALEEQFLGEAGGLTDSIQGPGVRLAVVDTAPTNAQDPENDAFNSPHGYLLVHMARKLLCPAGDENCAAAVTARLTLRYLSFHPRFQSASVIDNTKGGFVGLIGDLARDAHEEVRAWQLVGNADPLVLNLSLGWNGDFNGLAPTAVLAVRSALGDAVCRGAVAVAAAGNQDWGPDPSREPLYPAAWEQIEAPTRAQCTGVFGVPNNALAGYEQGGYRPLVHSVGAVRADGSTVPLARFDSEPRLVAFGDHGMVQTRRESEATEPLTGTSVAALVVSTTAAGLLAERPRPPAERRWSFSLMADLYERSEALPAGRSAEVFFPARDPVGGPAAGPAGGPPLPVPEVRRVQLCEVLDRPCAPRQPRRPLAQADKDALFPAAAAGGRTQEVDLSGYTGQERALGVCPSAAVVPRVGQDVVRLRPGQAPPRFPCPHWQLSALWANLGSSPQPGSGYCSGCEWDQNSPVTVFVEIDTLSFPWITSLSNPALKVGNKVFPLELDLDLDRARREPIRAVLRNVPREEGEPIFFSVVVDERFSSTCFLLDPPPRP